MDYVTTYRQLISPLFKSEITVENLAQIAAYFYREDSKNNTVKRPPLPYSLRLGKDFFDGIDEELLFNIRCRFISIFQNIFTFIRCVFFPVFSDFSLAEKSLNRLGFNNVDINREFVLIFVVYFLKTERKDEFALFETLKSELQIIRRDKLLTRSVYNDLLAAHHGYFLYSKNVRVVSDQMTNIDVTTAYDSIDILKNEIKISSICDQMMVVADYYDGNTSATKLQKCITKKSYQFLDQGNRDQKTLLDCCLKLCRILRYTSPHQILEAFYQKKKEASIDGNRDVGALIECSLLYHRFSCRLEPSDNVLLVCPTPYFIRKYYTDNLTKDINTTIILPSQGEKRLWTQDYSRNEGKTSNYKFFTIDEFIEESISQPISIIVVNALPDESTDLYTGMNNTLSSLSDYLCKTFDKALVYCLCSDKSLSYPDFFSYSFIRNHKEITSMLFLPNETDSKKKLFWIGRNSNNSTLTRCFNSYFEKHAEKTILVSDRKETATFDAKQYYESIQAGKHFSINSFIKKQNTIPPNTTRNKPIRFEVTPEISIYYTVSQPKNYPEKVDVRAYYKQKSIVDGTEIFKRLDKDKIVSWLKDGYLFEEISKGKQDSIKVRDKIATEIQKQKAGLPLSLKTFVYIYPEIRNQLSEEQYKKLEELAFKSDIGEISIASISEEVINEALPEDYDISEIFDIFSIAFDYAKTKEHLSYNPFNDVSDDTLFTQEHYARLILSSVRSKLAKKTFTTSEFKEFYKRVMNKIETEHDVRYIAVLLKALTGLEASPISVLQWQDFHKIPRYGIYQLDIYKYQIKQKTNEAVPFELFGNDVKFRCIPCCQTLTQVLLEEKKRKNPEATDYIFSDTGKSPIEHREITKTFKNILNDMNLPKLAEQTINEESLSLSDYGGDLLRENFRFYAIDKAGLTNDEIAYLLGNVPPTTFGHYYCDFFNHSAQYLLMTKLNRLDAILTKEELFEKNNHTQSLAGNHDYPFESKVSVFPIQLNISGKNKSKNDPVELTITSDFGIKYYIHQEPFENENI